MKIKVVLALAALSYAPPTVAGDKDVYPKERVAEFIVEKLDLTSLPAALRPKKEKGKKTFADYGFTARGMDEAETIIQAAGGTRKLSIKVLDQRSSGIYVKPSSKRRVARGSCRSKFSTRDPPESTFALPSRGKLPVRRRCKVWSC